MGRILISMVFVFFNLQAKDNKIFRSYTDQTLISKTYEKNHTKQTVDFVLRKKEQYIKNHRTIMTMWNVAEKMKTFFDESDPDTCHPQIVHALQVGQAMRKDGLPRQWIVTGFIHDFGKILLLFGEPQWAVVGDTFPVGCAFSHKIVYQEFFKNNPDTLNTTFNTRYGIYHPHCGLNALHLSWGHDEYLYQIIKDSKLSEEAKYAIRYHSFYAHHEQNAYDHLLNAYDHKMLKWIQLLNKYDLYTKIEEPLDIEKLLPFYQELVEEFFPEPLYW